MNLRCPIFDFWDFRKEFRKISSKKVFDKKKLEANCSFSELRRSWAHRFEPVRALMVYFWKLFWILGNLTWNSEFRSHFSSRTKFREKSCIFSQNQCEISPKTWFKSGFFITKCIKIVSEAITVCVGIFPAEKHRLILQIGSKKSQMRIWVVRGWARPLKHLDNCCESPP